MSEIRSAMIAAAVSLALTSPSWAASPSEMEEVEGKGGVVIAASETTDSDSSGEESAPMTRASDELGPMPIFIPRDMGAPLARVGGATRGLVVRKRPSIDVLVPEEVGYTLQAQPVLYWQVSDATDSRVDFKLIVAGSSDPLVEKTLAGPLEAGVHRIELASHQVTLEPGVTYLWYVSLIPDANDRSEDRIAGGAIERISVPGLESELAAAAVDRRAFVLAEAGIWYDAVRALSESIAAAAEKGLPGAQRAALLTQVGITEVSMPDPGSE